MIDGSDRIFKGNIDQDGYLIVKFGNVYKYPYRVKGRQIRLKPIEWVGERPCLRLEVYFKNS
jgi:hypothetical protein